jgi:hypothetical protein
VVCSTARARFSCPPIEQQPRSFVRGAGKVILGGSLPPGGWERERAAARAGRGGKARGGRAERLKATGSTLYRKPFAGGVALIEATPRKAQTQLARFEVPSPLRALALTPVNRVIGRNGDNNSRPSC